MKSYDAFRKTHIAKIVECEHVVFCKEALDKIEDTSVLEGIAKLTDMINEKKCSETGVDYQINAVSSGTTPVVNSYAAFKDIEWKN